MFKKFQKDKISIIIPLTQMFKFQITHKKYQLTIDLNEI